MNAATLANQINAFDAYFRSANNAALNARTTVPTAEWIALREPVLALAQSVQPLSTHVPDDQVPPVGAYGWKPALLDGRTLVRDKMGMCSHPALPSLDEAVDLDQFFGAFGIQLVQSSADVELSPEKYNQMSGVESKSVVDFSDWAPRQPAGKGWMLVSIHDTPDCPVAWWLRDASAD